MKTYMPTSGALMLGVLLVGCSTMAASDSVVTAVFSSVSNGYVRDKLPDGSFKPETYVVGNGGTVYGTVPNPAGDDVTFPAIVRLLARHLAKKNYLPASDSKSADLLLIYSWGKTIPFNDSPQRAGSDQLFTAMNNLNAANASVQQSVAQREAQSTPDGIQSPGRSVADAARDALEGQLFQMQMFNDMRMQANEWNARLLGYVKEINNKNNPSRFAGGGTYFDDLIADIENQRYYVIISAYDFRVAAQEKKRKLLWATRVSVDAQGNRFTDSLTTMLANASRQFGQDSGKLLRQYQTGRVDLGELKILGMVPESTLPAKPAQEK